MARIKNNLTISKLKKFGNTSIPQKMILFALIFAFIDGVYLLRGFAYFPRPKCNERTFYQGSTGACVSDIQFILNGVNYRYKFAGNYLLAVDGKYGPATKLLVAGLQKTSGYLKVDGVVGPKTWQEMCRDINPNWYASPLIVYKQAYFAAHNAGCYLSAPPLV